VTASQAAFAIREYKDDGQSRKFFQIGLDSRMIHI
jgi:hypothetical protein